MKAFELVLLDYFFDDFDGVLFDAGDIRTGDAEVFCDFALGEGDVVFDAVAEADYFEFAAG